ncbi:MAG: amino acid ABC transporter ATP-binding protein, partial [Thermoguttaceae bacterium]|nr:amino acid ABC transporter ATP-binding protein [Thermoguttaceae bacterium]
MITIKNLRKSFGDVEVLRGVNATINKGCVVSIVGPSGAGKSTFLHCLNRLEEPDSGEIIVDGEDVLAPSADPRKLRMKMGMVFQQFNLFPHLTALENITLAPTTLKKIPVKEAKEKALDLLERVGLAGKSWAFPSELSGGQQQRVAIARALAMDPEIVLFDEPTSALDPETK